MADKVAEAARRERETQQQMDAPAEGGPFATDPEYLAKLWAAKHAEWRRIAALLETSRKQVYDPEQDPQGVAWAQERETRRQDTLTGTPRGPRSARTRKTNYGRRSGCPRTPAAACAPSPPERASSPSRSSPNSPTTSE
ncbi:hypothetical protein ABZ554_00655 [Streptomyces sp. NPDC020125]|uniref:hypothetical protein n=1 Tax=Streptomyces sp. NPDC020125 TaxID=3154593 RepID=UPI00340AE0A9